MPSTLATLPDQSKHPLRKASVNKRLSNTKCDPKLKKRHTKLKEIHITGNKFPSCTSHQMMMHISQRQIYTSQTTNSRSICMLQHKMKRKGNKLINHTETQITNTEFNCTRVIPIVHACWMHSMLLHDKWKETKMFLR